MEPLNSADQLTGRTATADLVVVGGRLVTPEGVKEGAVVIRNGRIDAVLEPGEQVPEGPRVDAAGRYVLPGLIDSHVHFRTPGLEYKEDWEHGSRAAIAGGVTTVLDMPNTRPPSLNEDDVRAKAAIIEGRSWVDYRFHIGADPEHPEVLATLDPEVATSAKVFMAGHHTAPVVFRDWRALEDAFAAAARGNVQLVLHAEDQHIFDLLDTWRGEPGSYDEYEPHRPRSGAIVACAKVIQLVRTYGTRAHILHASTAEEADMLVAAAQEGLPLTFEVTGHHLSFTDADTCRRGPRTRLSPAIRGLGDQDRLWHAALTGEAASLGSDHAPHTIEEKSKVPADAPPGLPGVQELAIAAWTGMMTKRVDPDEAATHLARLMGSGPADLFRLPGKGRLVPGADADLAILDPAERWQPTRDDIQAKCGWSAYEGWLFRGRFTTVIKGGEQVWDVRSGFTGTPAGRWLAPAPAVLGQLVADTADVSRETQTVAGAEAEGTR
ncbi:dihydroorotase family protein [Streptomyces sp. NPDC086023]|uniref:dihydroorotase family protein n=1 Tax=Streptomyces sp. NPDC086023 TaxID=3365746 RepID=UPI0037CEB935